MKTIIAGSRTITDYNLVASVIRDSGFLITEVVSGKEPKGVDRLGEIWAAHYHVPVKEFPYVKGIGAVGGPVRNRQMARYADALIAIWDGRSDGTGNMIEEATKRGLAKYIRIVPPVKP